MYDRSRLFECLGDPIPPQALLVLQLHDLLRYIEADEGCASIPVAAYLLATAKHETAGSFRPCIERGLRAYFDKYELNTLLGQRLGNTQPGDGFTYRGRGYVQITGRDNYDRLGRALGIDLIAYPERAQEPPLAYRIMTLGMFRGLFTGRKLSDFVGEGKRDYVNARRTVNALDCAERIAEYALQFEHALTSSVIKP